MHLLEKRYEKNPDVVFRKIADEFILVPIKQKVVDLKSIYTLNELAAFIWEHVDSKNTLLEIQNKIMEEFDVSSGQVEADLTEILAQFSSLGLIQET